MNDLLTRLREKNYTAVTIGKDINQDPRYIAKQIKAIQSPELKRKPSLELLNWFRKNNLSDLLFGTQETAPREPTAPTSKEKHKIVFPDNVYSLFKARPVKKPIGDNQQRIYDTSIGKFLEAKFDKPLTDPTRRVISINKNKIYYKSDQIDTYLKQYKGNQYGESNKHLHWRNIRAFYKWLYKKYNYPNPIVNEKGEILVTEPMVNRNSVMPSITQKEMEILLSSPEIDTRDKLIMALPYGSAMRVSEWSELAYEDIDFNTNMVQVRTKGGEIRLMDIDLAIPYLKKYLAETGIKSGKLFQTSSKYKQLRGRRSFESRLTYNIQPIAREITGNPKLILTPHVFRRGNARMNLENKIPDNVAMLHGNWKDPRTYKKYGNAFNIEDASRVIRNAIKLNVGLPTLNI